MAGSGDIRSVLVYWLKILLPLLALAILSTLFLVSRRIDTEGALPYADVDVDALAREQRLTAPEYSGLTSDGTEFLMRAGVARPLEAGGGRAEDISAELRTQGGLGVEMSAAAGQVDPAAGAFSLTGDVVLSTSTGYRIETQGLTSYTSRTEVVSDGAIQATTPFGALEAGGMTLGPAPEGADAYVLVFKQGVKLVYEPEN
ncbi:hypothetical protein OEW28_01735 [Defluviimonas sp. WL0002]|uniref:Lipopolysaccharide export system protein LptC n=1 Tax=Albidovulum marisflavi TaxID=2984159 RepID=A0ABT2Z8D9_9RHOB|nr:hypothetical protein [Defluviimonas sp. WL0002]MCV2867347.1 hypothetical protein [Defluviimonas sp. WL0002]